MTNLLAIFYVCTEPVSRKEKNVCDLFDAKIGLFKSHFLIFAKKKSHFLIFFRHGTKNDFFAKPTDIECGDKVRYFFSKMFNI